MTVTREMILPFLRDRKSAVKKITALIDPNNIYSKYSGVTLGIIHNTPHGSWSTVLFPSWVEVKGTEWERKGKWFRYSCDENGNLKEDEDDEQAD